LPSKKRFPEGASVFPLYVFKWAFINGLGNFSTSPTYLANTYKIKNMKVLTYHSIGYPPKGARLKTLYVKPSSFRRQIRLLKFLGFEFGTSESLFRRDKQKVVVLTFDDAYRDFYENAFPFLVENNIKAIVFVPAGLVGQFNKWDYEKVRAIKPIMDWGQLKDLVDAGMEVGSHTITHPYLTRLPFAQAKEEIEGSKKLLEDKLGVEIRAFCYPYGDYNEQIRDMVAEAGYSVAYTTVSGSVEESPNFYEIRRVTVFGNDFLPKLLMKVLL